MQKIHPQTRVSSFQDSSVRLGSTSRGQLMSPQSALRKTLSFARLLVAREKAKFHHGFISVLQSAQ